MDETLTITDDHTPKAIQCTNKSLVLPIHNVQTGDILGVTVNAHETVETLKRRIETVMGIPVEGQRLLFNTQLLPDEYPLVLDKWWLRPWSNVYLLPRPLVQSDSAPLNIDEAFLVKVELLDGTLLDVGVKPDDTADGLMRFIEYWTGVLLGRHCLIFTGKPLNEGLSLKNYGICEGSTLCLMRLGLSLPCGGSAWIFSNPVEARGLKKMAQAVALREWEGCVPGTKHGLVLRKGETVTIGRIVNDCWYEAFKDEKTFGIFNTDFEADFSAPLPLEDEQLETVAVKTNSIVQGILEIALRTFRVISRGNRSPEDSPTQLLEPGLPPWPVSKPLALDKTFEGSRLIVNFYLTLEKAKGSYTIHSKLSLNSAPRAQFSSLTLTLRLNDGVILAMSPRLMVGPETETQISKDKSLQTTANASLSAGNAPAASITGSLGATYTKAEHMEFTRRTYGTVQGSGVGSQKAYWVMKEDSGPAGQFGLNPEFDLEAELNVRPAVVSYDVVIGIRRDNGKERVIRCENLRYYF